MATSTASFNGDGVTWRESREDRPRPRNTSGQTRHQLQPSQPPRVTGVLSHQNPPTQHEPSPLNPSGRAKKPPPQPYEPVVFFQPYLHHRRGPRPLDPIVESKGDPRNPSSSLSGSFPRKRDDVPRVADSPSSSTSTSISRPPTAPNDLHADAPKKAVVQKGQINALQKMLSGLKR